ncbi:hypothetical protein [Lacihabitans sp. LS3-19]|uniref:hypothetical protein n=1 Tax=Lacihabitans sp. LS3-19 TaxID=2487335 RepID=UPI0020CBE1F7|nr:hypothetical protein [Lacihabitans sp. LS3-19]
MLAYSDALNHFKIENAVIRIKQDLSTIKAVNLLVVRVVKKAVCVVDNLIDKTIILFLNKKKENRYKAIFLLEIEGIQKKIKNNKLVFFLFLIILNLFNSKDLSAQDYINNYYPYIYDAEINFLNKKYNESFLNYSKAFSNEEGLRPNLMNAAVVAIKVKNYEQAIIWLKKAVEYGATIKSIEKLKNIRNLKKSKLWASFVQEYPTLRDYHLKGINKIYQEAINRMKHDDQLYRTGKYKKLRHQVVKNDTIKGWQGNPDIIKKITGFEIQKQIDNKNILELLELIEKYGFPSEKTIGVQSIKKDYQDPWLGAGLIIIHGFYIKDIKDKLFITLLNQIKIGNCYPQLLGYAYDYSNLTQFQKYGTGNTIKFSFPPFHVLPYSNIISLNKDRESIGIEPLENYQRKNRYLINKKSIK